VGLLRIAASRYCAPPMEFRCTPSLAERDWAVDTLAAGSAQDDHGPWQQALEPASAPSERPLLEQRRFKGKAGECFSTFTRWARHRPQLIVVGLGRAGWRCRRSGAVAGCSDRQAAAAVKAFRSSASARPATDSIPRARPRAMPSRCGSPSLPTSASKRKVRTRCGAGSIQPVGAAGVGPGPV